jgi:hypothetical protein
MNVEMSRPGSRVLLLCLFSVAAIFVFMGNRREFASVTPVAAGNRAYLGFDRNVYPGDVAMPVLRKTFAFTGYWLSPPPGEKKNTWQGEREWIRSLGFGFLVLYRGRDSGEIKTVADATKMGSSDAADAIASAKRERFPSGTIIFLDIEEGGRLPETYHAYLRVWTEELKKAGVRAGVYCSGMPVKEEPTVSITTANDIRAHAPTRDIAVWVYNDSCPPAPGCGFPENPPVAAASGIPTAAVWQFAQSPRRNEYSARCATTYAKDGNCYAPGDTTHSWFLDVNSATSADPSNGR